MLSPIPNNLNTKHALWVEYDNDGDSDLFVTSLSQNLLYRNNGQFVFEDITKNSGLPLFNK